MAPPFDIQLPYMRDVVTLDFAVEWLRLRWQTHVHILTNTSPPSDSFAAPTGFYADWAPGSTTVMWAWFDSPTDTGTPRYVGWKWYWFGGDTPAPGTTGAEEGAAVILASTVGAEPQINDPSGYQSNEAVGLYEGWCGPYALNTWWAGPPPAGAKGVAVGCFYCLSFDEDSNTFVGEGLHSIWVLPVSTGEGEDT